MILSINACTHSKTANTNLPRQVAGLSSADSIQLMEEVEDITPQNHSRIMNLILGKPKHTIKDIGILVYDGANVLDIMGPRYILGQSMGAKTQLIGIKSGNIKTATGVEIVPDAIIDTIDQLDIVIIPGGAGATAAATYDERLLSWIREIDKNTLYTGAVCTGGWILGASGLLEGREASTNWYREERFLKKYKASPANERYTQDGKYWTSAGVTAGMDMCIAMMADIYGDRYAQGVMLDMEYDPAPPIAGGSPEKTNWMVRWMMRSMYDAAINPIIDSLDNLRVQSL